MSDSVCDGVSYRRPKKSVVLKLFFYLSKMSKCVQLCCHVKEDSSACALHAQISTIALAWIAEANIFLSLFVLGPLVGGQSLQGKSVTKGNEQGRTYGSLLNGASCYTGKQFRQSPVVAPSSKKPSLDAEVYYLPY